MELLIEMRKIYFIGIGPGKENNLTREASGIIESADVLIGAKRMLEMVTEYEKRPHFISYKPEEIQAYLEQHMEFQAIAMLYSGDVGFYSGAQGLAKILSEQYEKHFIAGVSSLVYFMNRLGISYEDAKLLSMHGRNCNLVNQVLHHHKVATLLGNEDDVANICERLAEYGAGDCKVFVGERLSYEDENITVSTAEQLTEKKFDKLSVVVFENEEVRRILNVKDALPESEDKFYEIIPGMSLPDELFIRGKAPMTKEEIRTLSVAKLHLPKNAVVYDIGSGTGSVSVQMALQCEDGVVYAIERFPEGIELARQNAVRFGCANMEVIAGMAPDCLKDLPAPTHVFIGGSGGELMNIIEVILEKNPHARFVLNAVTLETMSLLQEIPKLYEKHYMGNDNQTNNNQINEYKQNVDIEIIQINVSRNRTLGSYQMMQAENPVTIASWEG